MSSPPRIIFYEVQPRILEDVPWEGHPGGHGHPETRGDGVDTLSLLGRSDHTKSAPTLRVRDSECDSVELF